MSRREKKESEKISCVKMFAKWLWPLTETNFCLPIEDSSTSRDKKFKYSIYTARDILILG